MILARRQVVNAMESGNVRHHCREIVRKLMKVRVLQQPKRGPSHERNEITNNRERIAPALKVVHVGHNFLDLHVMRLVITLRHPTDRLVVQQPMQHVLGERVNYQNANEKVGECECKLPP